MTVAPEQIASLERKVGTQARSPLFAQLAAFYLEIGRAKDALRLCDSGLANHPYYATAHLIKGRALAALNLRAEARREFELVLEWLPGNPTVRALLRALPRLPEETLVAPAETLVTPVVEPKPEPEPETTPEPPAPAREPEPTDDRYTETPPGIPEEMAQEAPFEPEPEPHPTYDYGEPAESPEDVSPSPVSSEDPGAGSYETLHSLSPEPTEETAPPTTETETPTGSTSYEAVTFQADTAPDPFGFGIPSGSGKQTTVATPAPEEPPAFSGFDVPADTSTFLAGIPQPEPEPSGIPSPESRGEEHGGGFGFQGPDFVFSGPADEDTFDKYALRMRAELSGENTMVLEDYYSGREPVVEAPREPAVFPSPKKDKIEELTEKLQSAKRITPVINIAQKTTTAASEKDTPTSTGFVTPTLAEIYAKQGWYDDAIRAYRTLAVTKPADKERFERRIGELEDLKKKSGA